MPKACFCLFLKFGQARKYQEVDFYNAKPNGRCDSSSMSESAEFVGSSQRSQLGTHN